MGERDIPAESPDGQLGPRPDSSGWPWPPPAPLVGTPWRAAAGISRPIRSRPEDCDRPSGPVLAAISAARPDVWAQTGCGALALTLAAAVLLVFVGMVDGFDWWMLISAPLWVALSLLSAWAASRHCQVQAGADWVGDVEHDAWVAVYSLTAIELTDTAPGGELALTDSLGRKARLPLGALLADRYVWDLVYNGLRHSARTAAVAEPAYALLRLSKPPQVSLALSDPEPAPAAPSTTAEASTGRFQRCSRTFAGPGAAFGALAGMAVSITVGIFSGLLSTSADRSGVAGVFGALLVLLPLGVMAGVIVALPIQSLVRLWRNRPRPTAQSPDAPLSPFWARRDRLCRETVADFHDMVDASPDGPVHDWLAALEPDLEAASTDARRLARYGHALEPTLEATRTCELPAGTAARACAERLDHTCAQLRDLLDQAGVIVLEATDASALSHTHSHLEMLSAQLRHLRGDA